MAASSLLSLQQALGHVFATPQLLRTALTHRSHSTAHYERLEFLGDSVLNCAVSALLYQAYPESDEGLLSRVRSHLVRQECLANLATQLGVGPCIMLGMGEKKGGGAIKESLLADVLEALLGAVFLDAGFEAASQCVAKLFDPIVKNTPLHALGKDAKTQLQEYLQGKKMPLPIYTVLVEGGMAHQAQFTVRCAVAVGKPKPVQEEGVGLSRRAAEQEAAQRVLVRLIEKI